MSKAKRKTEGALALLTRDLFAAANLVISAPTMYYGSADIAITLSPCM